MKWGVGINTHTPFVLYRALYRATNIYKDFFGGITMPEKTYMEIAAESLAPRCIALGEECKDVVIAEIDNTNKITDKEKIEALEQRVYELTNSIDSMFVIIKGLMSKINSKEIVNNNIEKSKGKLEIPEGTVLNGKTGGVNYYLVVKSDGFYVGETRYPSLSAAAEGVSGTRRSGLVFWTLPDGRTIKEVYKG